MMTFRKLSAASKGSLLLAYFTEQTPEPTHGQAAVVIASAYRARLHFASQPAAKLTVPVAGMAIMAVGCFHEALGI